jgi:hypothetical protein
MLAKWTQILPVFIYKYIAKKLCATIITIGNIPCIQPDNDILIRKNK